jgi:hypothetical protein
LTPYTGVCEIFFLVKICYLPAGFARRGIIYKIEQGFDLVSKNSG